MPPQLAYARTISNNSAEEAAQELLDEMPELGDPPLRGWGRPASIQRFRSRQELDRYLNLVDALTPKPALSTTSVIILALLAIGGGALVGWYIRKWREKRGTKPPAKPKPSTKPLQLAGLDILGAS